MIGVEAPSTVIFSSALSALWRSAQPCLVFCFLVVCPAVSHGPQVFRNKSQATRIQAICLFFGALSAVWPEGRLSFILFRPVDQVSALDAPWDERHDRVTSQAVSCDASKR